MEAAVWMVQDKEIVAFDVESSNIARVGHDGEKTLYVAFKDRRDGSGRWYRYDGVPYELYCEAVRADSVGKFVSSRIKGTFECQPVEDAKLSPAWQSRRDRADEINKILAHKRILEERVTQLDGATTDEEGRTLAWIVSNPSIGIALSATTQQELLEAISTATGEEGDQVLLTLTARWLTKQQLEKIEEFDGA